MKTAKENYLIKTVFAYIDLFYKLILPFFLIFHVVPLLLIFPNFSKSNWNEIDFLGIFSYERGYVILFNTSVFYKSSVFFLNFIIVVGIFYSLKKLNRFMKNVFEGNPFNLENGKALKSTGIIISFLAITVHIAKSVLFFLYGFENNLGINSYMLTMINIVSVIFNPYMVIGLFVMILGEIIIGGYKIKEENDLTV